MVMFQSLARVMTGVSTLKIRCDGCGRQAEWTQAEALRRIDPFEGPYDIRRRMVCMACGAKGEVRIWI